MLIKALQEQIKHKESECQSLDQAYLEFAERTRADKASLKALRKELKKRKNLLVTENLAISEELHHLHQRAKEVHEDEEELKAVLGALKEEMEVLEENLLRVNLKLTQVHNERQRMEDELRRYTKQGRQPKA